MRTRKQYALPLIGIFVYIGILLYITQNQASLSALQIVLVCGAYILINTVYSGLKKHLTFNHFMEYSALAFFVAIIALLFLT